MVKITVETDCGNAPKKEFIRDFIVAFANKNSEAILSSFDDDIYWEVIGGEDMKGVEKIKSELPTMLKDTMKELVIENIITHGDAGAANGAIEFSNGAKGAFSDIFKFSSHGKSAKIKKITLFLIELQR